MKKLFILLAVVLLQSISACTKEPVEEIKPEPDEPEVPVEPVEPTQGTIQFTLKGACEMTALPDSTIGIRETETIVEDLNAIIFKDSTYYKSIEVKKDANDVYGIQENPGKYSMYLIANAGSYIQEEFKKLTPGKSSIKDLKAIRIKSAPTASGAVVMLSKDMTSFEIKEGKTDAIEKVEMYRPLIRVDILTGATGVKLTSLRIANAVTAVSIKDKSDMTWENLEITNLKTDGSPDSPAINIGVCYIFPSTAYDPEESTIMTLTYEFDGEVKNAERFLTNNMVNKPDMIWGFMTNIDKTLRSKEIIAKMTEGYKPVFTVPAVEYQVGTGLDGSAQCQPSVISAIKPYKYESNVQNAYFIFMKGEKLYEIQKGQKYATAGFRSIIYENGIFDINLVANVSEELGKKLEALPKGSDRKAIYDLMAEQAPDTEDNFLMLGKDFVSTEVRLNWTYLRSFPMERLASRIDIINGVKGLSIDKAVFKNRVIKTSLKPEGLLDGALEEKTYTGFEGIGDPQNYASYTGKIYTYQNLSKETAPEIILYYTLNGHSYEKSINFSSVGGILKNSLYSITLSGNDVNAKVEKQNWAEGYNPNVGNLQEEQNNKLAVSQFTAYNVSRIDGTNVTFATHNTSVKPETEGASGYFKWDATWPDKIYTDKDGHKYKIPSKEEMLLLFPDKDNILCFNKRGVFHSIKENLPEKILGKYNGGTCESEFMSMDYKRDIAGVVCYAKRFKGTDQYAAYRYEIMNCKMDGDEAYLSIKIKAMAKDDDPKLIYMTDHHSPEYWKSGYFEYRIPLAGAISGNQVMLRGSCTDLWCAGSEKTCIFITFNGSSNVFKAWKEDDSLCLRMIKMD